MTLSIFVYFCLRVSFLFIYLFCFYSYSFLLKIIGRCIPFVFFNDRPTLFRIFNDALFLFITNLSWCHLTTFKRRKNVVNSPRFFFFFGFF